MGVSVSARVWVAKGVLGTNLVERQTVVPAAWIFYHQSAGWPQNDMVMLQS